MYCKMCQILLIIFFVFCQLCYGSLDSFSQYSTQTNVSIEEYASQRGLHDFDRKFFQFKIQNNRKYDSEVEEQRRKLNFLKALEFIVNHNQLFERGLVSHSVALNQFADLSPEEHHVLFSMPIPLPFEELGLSTSADIAVNSGLPQSFDWRQRNKVTPVKNQGVCGSCWAFTTIAIVESEYAIRYNESVVLSEQQLVDCMDSHCKGQQISNALSYVLKNGVERNADYPYRAQAKQCKNEADKYHAHIKGYATMGKAANGRPATDEQIMSVVVSTGPVGFVFESSGNDFVYYKSGILTTAPELTKGWKSVHSMAIVGWGSANGTDYWVAKNSWGTHWGEKGFVRLVRGKNIRGMNYYIYYPKL